MQRLKSCNEEKTLSALAEMINRLPPEEATAYKRLIALNAKNLNSVALAVNANYEKHRNRYTGLDEEKTKQIMQSLYEDEVDEVLIVDKCIDVALQAFL